MRKFLFTLLATGAMIAAVPAASLAHGGDHHVGDRHREHHHGRHHDRVRHERFGGQDGFHHNVGTVSAFANGRLTIRLNDGSNVSGAITRASEIECRMPAVMQTADQGAGGGSGSGSGSRSGGGSGNDNGQGDPGDDNGQDGPNHNAGDDNGPTGGDNDPGDDNGERRCTMIAPGMVVGDATLTLTGSGAVWTRLDLIGS